MHKKNKELYAFLDYKEQNKSFNRIESIIRILYRLHCWEKEKCWSAISSIRKSQILKEDSLIFFKYWDNVKPLYFKAFEWMQEKNISHLLSVSMRETLIFALLANERIFQHPQALENVKKIVLFEAYNNTEKKQSSVLKNLLDYLSNYLSRNTYNEVHIPELQYAGFDNFNITPQQILEAKSTTALGKLIIHLMKFEKNGYFNKDLFDMTIDKHSDFDEHHIVPFSRRERFGISVDMINSIANITLLNAQGNRQRIKDSLYYFDELEELHGKEKLERLLNGNLLPDIQLFKENPKLFIEKRAEKLCEFLKNYFH